MSNPPLTLVLIVMSALFTTGAATADTPPPPAEEVVDAMIRAAGGEEAFGALGVIKLEVSEEETLSDGTVKHTSFVAYADGMSPDSLRLELPGETVLAKTVGGAWASLKGERDPRPQSPRMAQGTLNAKLFPILLPFSLRSRGVELGTVETGTLDGTPTWRLEVRFRPGFFSAPSMSGPWHLHAEQASGRLLAAEFLPPVEYRAVADEGMRYIALKTSSLGGVTLPQQLLLDGIDFNRVANGHVRLTRIALTVHADFDPTLFMDPRDLDALDRGEVLD